MNMIISKVCCEIIVNVFHKFHVVCCGTSFNFSFQFKNSLHKLCVARCGCRAQQLPAWQKCDAIPLKILGGVETKPLDVYMGLILIWKEELELTYDRA
jgi:hypothetical protein